MVDFIDEDIAEVMQITGLDKVKATKLFKAVAADLDDGTDDELCSYDVIEVIKTEKAVKGSTAPHRYVTTAEPTTKERKPRTHKTDTDKERLVDLLKKGLTLGMDSTGIAVCNDSKLEFEYNGNAYTVTLTKHRPPKTK